MFEEGDQAYIHMKKYVDAVASPSGDWAIDLTIEDIKKRYNNIPWEHHTQIPDNLRW